MLVEVKGEEEGKEGKDGRKSVARRVGAGGIWCGGLGAGGGIREDGGARRMVVVVGAVVGRGVEGGLSAKWTRRPLERRWWSGEGARGAVGCDAWERGDR